MIVVVIVVVEVDREIRTTITTLRRYRLRGIAVPKKRFQHAIVHDDTNDDDDDDNDDN